jgi:predicted dehydrogenase
MRAAIIGAGQIAQKHLECLSQAEMVDVVGVCDLSPALAQAAAERFGVTRWYTDIERLLAEAAPDVVHVTTPAPTHFPIAMRALQDAHVFVEKPMSFDAAEIDALITSAAEHGRVLVEDYNYVFNGSVQRILELVRTGRLGDVLHVDIFIAVDILGEGSPFTDQNLPHPAIGLPGGAIGDFVTHLSSLAHAFIGPAETARSTWWAPPGSRLPGEEMRALVKGATASASLGFSARAQPDTFTIRVHGSRMRATASLFEPRITVERTHDALPRPTVPLINGFVEAQDAVRGAVGGLWGKLAGAPGSYDGLFRLIGETYASIRDGSRPPVTTQDIAEVNDLVRLLLDEGARL